MFSSYQKSNIILHVVLICLFIIILFLTYGVYLEKKVLSNQITYTIKKLTEDVTPFLPPNTDIASLVSLKETPDTAEVSNQISSNNSAILKKVFTFSGIFVIVSLLLIFFISYKSKKVIGGETFTLKNFLKKLFQENIILLIFVGMVYAGFVSYISFTYIYVDVNLLRRNIIDNLIKFRDQPILGNYNSTKINSPSSLSQLNIGDFNSAEINSANFNSAEINSPRSNLAELTAGDFNSPKSDSPKSDSPKSDSPKTKSNINDSSVNDDGEEYLSQIKVNS